MQNQEFISPESFHQLSTWVEKDRNKNIWRSYRESASLTFYLNFPEKYQQIFCCLLKIQLKWKSIPAITCPHLGVWALTSYPPRTTSTPTPTHTHTHTPPPQPFHFPPQATGNRTIPRRCHSQEEVTEVQGGKKGSCVGIILWNITVENFKITRVLAFKHPELGACSDLCLTWDGHKWLHNSNLLNPLLLEEKCYVEVLLCI